MEDIIYCCQCMVDITNDPEAVFANGDDLDRGLCSKCHLDWEEKAISKMER